jgi:hypothetical protein
MAADHDEYQQVLMARRYLAEARRTARPVTLDCTASLAPTTLKTNSKTPTSMRKPA